MAAILEVSEIAPGLRAAAGGLMYVRGDLASRAKRMRAVTSFGKHEPAYYRPGMQ
jgi:hypothetical protein